MWRLVLLRCLIAMNWILAGLSFAQVVFGHPRGWSSFYLNVARSEMVAEGVEEPSDVAHSQEWFRRSNEVRSRFAGMEQGGYYGWLIAMSGGTATALGLMIVFPGLQAALQRNASPNSQPPAANQPASNMAG